jgi:site-specific recombinase XerD
MSVPALPQTATDYARAALSPATLAVYRADWQDFYNWCRGQGLAPLPPAAETVATYLASLALTHSDATRRRRLAAIAQAHRLKGVEWTTPALVKRTLRGINRQHPTPKRQASADHAGDQKAARHLRQRADRHPRSGADLDWLRRRTPAV